MIDYDRRARIYALNLLNRLGKPFDVREVNTLAAVLPLIEADVADCLAVAMVVAASSPLTVAGVRAGKPRQIGRAPCRERVRPIVYIPVAALSSKKNTH